ncbi:hypothetical protein NDK43_05675 [Neobacillus pocheonensis]|uniref:Uncharacterized protein n=1 Tax=Neobacillus pocheonensis TaxID=363869 RepID=A0ABT0W6L4_9BACI|nr:hypothetical protein [Neobacillus pocheonensis]
MRKLCVVVIVLSFFGYGPLKSFFHTVMNTDGKSTSGETIIQKIKDSTNLFPQSDNKKVENYLLTENSGDKKSSLTGSAMVLRYDNEKHKLMVTSILLPGNLTNGNGNDLDAMKKEVEKDYKVTIDHYFNLDSVGLAHIVDLLAPKGINLNHDSSKYVRGNGDNKLNGNEFVSIINTGNPDKINAVVSALKNEIETSQSAEKLVTLAPSIINEAIKSVKTDLGKGELMALGYSAMMNPITSIVSLQLAGKNQLEKANTVNSIVGKKGQNRVFN